MPTTSGDAPKPRKRLSKRQYLTKRKRRVGQLHATGLGVREIAEKLVKEGTITTTDESLDSAVRLVRDDVREFRENLASERGEDAKVGSGGNEIDALVRELADLREEHARQKMIAAGEPREHCARSRFPVAECVDPACVAMGAAAGLGPQHVVFVGPAIAFTLMDTPQGPMTSWRALWPAGARQKASKDATLIAARISALEVRLAEKQKALASTVHRSANGTTKSETFTFNLSGKSMDELLDERSGGKAAVN